VVRARGTPREGQVPQGYYDLEVFERTDTGVDYLMEMLDSEEVRSEYERKGFAFPAMRTSTATGHRLQHARPGDGRGADAEQGQERNRKLRQAITIAIDWDEYSKHLPKKAASRR
jgi:hypothetical protein